MCLPRLAQMIGRPRTRFPRSTILGCDHLHMVIEHENVGVNDVCPNIEFHVVNWPRS